MQPDDDQIEEEDIEVEEAETKNPSRPASKMDLEDPIATSSQNDDDDEEEVIYSNSTSINNIFLNEFSSIFYISIERTSCRIREERRRTEAKTKKRLGLH